MEAYTHERTFSATGLATPEAEEEILSIVPSQPLTTVSYAPSTSNTASSLPRQVSVGNPSSMETTSSATRAPGLSGCESSSRPQLGVRKPTRYSLIPVSFLLNKE